MNDIPLHVQYAQRTAENLAAYGERSVVLMLVGSFYEVYAYRYPTGDVAGSSLVAIAALCDLNTARKQALNNLSALSATVAAVLPGRPRRDAPCELVMVGFRDYSLDKYLTILTNAGWTVAVYDQGPAGAPRRLAQVYSPGTAFLGGPATSSSSIACVWLSESRARVVGYAAVNIHTGECSVGEAVYPKSARTSPLHPALEHFMEAHCPREVLLVCDGVPKAVSTRVGEYLRRDAVLRELEPSRDADVDACGSQVYRATALERLFPDGSTPDSCVLSALRDQELATQAFVLLLQTVSRQCPKLVAMLQSPRTHSSGRDLRMANSSLTQLNVVGRPGSRGVRSSLLSLVEASALTAAGRRSLRRSLLMPSAQADVVERSLGATAAFITDTEFTDAVSTELRAVCDLEVEHRRLVLGRASPGTLSRIWETLERAVAVAALAADSDAGKHADGREAALAAARELLASLEATFDRPALVADCFDARIFLASRQPDLDALHAKRDTGLRAVEAVRSWCSHVVRLGKIPTAAGEVSSLPDDRTVVRHIPASSPSTLQLTSKRAALLLEAIKRAPGTVTKAAVCDVWGPLDVESLTTPAGAGARKRLASPQLDRLHAELAASDTRIASRTREAFHEAATQLGERGRAFQTVAAFLADVDALRAKAHLATKRGYVRPRVVPPRADGGSRFAADGLRHPLIELINTKETYVANDISLGQEGEERGSLIYGTNAVGKSSLVKAVGMAIVLAQGGFFVPCEDFAFSPFTALYTRILGNDDLFKGLSTFAVEMLELDAILRDGDERSLVLGDELCSGTETSSAVAIFAAGLEHITAAGSCFLFATHLHETASLECTGLEKPVSCKHMAVEYDLATDTLTYVRRLRDGPGASVYGLEVCRALKMPSSFLERASSIRDERVGLGRGLAAAPKSRYNAAKLRDICELCGKKADEIHHLVPQREADASRRARGIHVDHPANLLAVCEACHDAAHGEGRVEMRRRTRIGAGYALA